MAEAHPPSGPRAKDNPPLERGRFHAVSAFKDGWIAHKRLVLQTAILAMSFAAVV
jgi:hypothetical protein